MSDERLDVERLTINGFIKYDAANHRLSYNRVGRGAITQFVAELNVSVNDILKGCIACEIGRQKRDVLCSLSSIRSAIPSKYTIDFYLYVHGDLSIWQHLRTYYYYLQCYM